VRHGLDLLRLPVSAWTCSRVLAFCRCGTGASDNLVGRAGLGAEGFCMADKVTIPLRVPRQLLAQTYEPARRGVLNRSEYRRRAAAMAAAKQVAAS
jgi:hypothetical protein